MKPKLYTYFDGGSGYPLAELSKDAIRGCSGIGGQAANVRAFMNDPRHVRIVADRQTIERALDVYGAWEDLDTASNETLWERVVWIAAGDMSEEPRMYGLRL